MKIIDIKKTSTKEIISNCIEVLNSGGLIIFPTETTYGAGVDATNPRAVDKILAYKSRREGKPLSVALSNKETTSEYIYINDQANALIDQFLPGPMTVVCKAKPDSKIAPGVISEFGTLGIRIPDYKLILDLLRKFQKPITATSANGSNKKRPYTVDDVLNNLSEKQKKLIDLILDAGELPHNEPSTVIDTTLSTPVTMRSRGIEKSQVTNLISKSESETKEIAGKLLLKHWNNVNEKGLLIALDGKLGTGKTIFTKGLAEFLKITQTVKSPTYSYIEEYDYKRHQTSGKLFHLDMWKVDSQDLFDKLEVIKLFGKNNVVVIEWFDQVSAFLFASLNKNTQLNKKMPKIIKIAIEQDDKTKTDGKDGIDSNIRKLKITLNVNYT
ncbi:MAG: threonylcarbamoyl-AMP synthase [Pseudomonadales bacterium]|nr:threonylcarbamoyl-AMP synthase [Pseudomonadales bacterium]